MVSESFDRGDAKNEYCKNKKKRKEKIVGKIL